MMEVLSDREMIVGFFSYSRDDDRDLNGSLSALRQVIEAELRSQLGRKDDTFQLWQDKTDINPGVRWEEELKSAINEAVFLIPIVTPRSVSSSHCRLEIESFIASESGRGRSDLMFPLLCITVPELENETSAKSHPVLSMIEQRQYIDWRKHRFHDANSPELRVEIARFCQQIVQALRRRSVAASGRARATLPSTNFVPPRPRKWRAWIVALAIVACLGGVGLLAKHFWDTVQQEQSWWAQATREQTRREQAGRDQAALDQFARDQATRDQAEREQVVRDRLIRDQASRDQIAREQASRDQAARDQSARDQAARDQLVRDQAARDQAARDQIARDQAARDQAARDQATREQLARDQASRDQLARDQAARDQSAREQAAREQAIQQNISRNLSAIFGIAGNIGVQRWTTLPATANCYSNLSSTYEISYSNGQIKWTSGAGDVDQEVIQSIGEQMISTSTIFSDHRNGRAEVAGTAWEYRVAGDRLAVSRNGRPVFRLRRCE